MDEDWCGSSTAKTTKENDLDILLMFSKVLESCSVRLCGLETIFKQKAGFQEKILSRAIVSISTF